MKAHINFEGILSNFVKTLKTDLQNIVDYCEGDLTIYRAPSFQLKLIVVCFISLLSALDDTKSYNVKIEAA